MLSPDDVVDLPRPPGVRGHELIQGRAVPRAALDSLEYGLRGKLAHRLADHVGARRLGGCIMSDVGFVPGLRREPGRLRIADIAYITRDQLDRHLEPRRALRCVPQLIVEFVPAGSRTTETARRMIDFLEARVQVLWLLDPRARQTLVYHAGNSRLLRHDEFIDAAPVFPAFRVRLESLFEACGV